MTKTDRQAEFEQVFEANYALVLAYARRRTAESEAEDVVAETFAIAWRKFGSIPAHATPWLLGVARRVLANRHRGDARRFALVERLRVMESSAVWDPEIPSGDRTLTRAL